MSETPSTPAGSSLPQFRVDDTTHAFRLGPRPSGSGFDGDLVDQTRNQIRELVDEIAKLSKSGCTTAEFYEGFLTRTTTALASSGGIIWTRAADDQPLEIAFHINFNQSSLATDPTAQAQHNQLLQRVVEAAEPLLVPPDSAGDSSNGGNPTKQLLIFAPLLVEERLIGLVEIFQRPGGGPATQRGYLRFLVQMTELASEFLQHRQWEELKLQQRLWHELQQFTHDVHTSLDLEKVAYIIANEGRRLLGCDRVAVTVTHGRRQRVVAVSGVDSIEPRAAEIKRLAELASAVVRGRDPLWFNGEMSTLAPQLEPPLQAYLDQSHGRSLALLPLHPPHRELPSDSGQAGADQPPLASLLIEQFSSAAFTSEQIKRIEQLQLPSSSALANASVVESIPLRNLLQQLQRLTRPFQPEWLPQTAGVIALTLLLTAIFCLLPWQFNLSAKGTLLPRDRQEIYAEINGTITSVFEADATNGLIEAGTVLAEISNHELQLQIERLEGELAKSEALISNLNHQQLEKSRSGNREQERRDRFYLETELAKATALRDGLQQELTIARRQAEALTVRNPLTGHLVDWQLRRQLLGRPVNRGDRLMTIVAPNSTFEVELFVPEKRMGHLLAELQSSPRPLPVRFTVASHPEQPLHGEVVEVEPLLALHESEGNSARIRVAFDNAQAADVLLRSGTRVTAQVQCGSRPLGYVLFHDLFDAIRGTWLLWF